MDLISFDHAQYREVNFNNHRSLQSERLFMANIKVFARLKPCQDIHEELIRREDQAIFIYPPGQGLPNSYSTSSSAIKNLQEFIPLRFRFMHVFGMKSSQKNVFDVAAKDIVKQFLEGYNGTIFAYGQTGAGKTYTIQGEAVESFDGSDYSGLVPQSLSLVFQEVAHSQNETVNIHVSFLEIYKETAYDLLGTLLFRGSKKPKELSKVLVTMGGNESCHLHGLSYHRVASVEEATKLYQLGVANRKKAETPDNQRLCRSHTVFSIMLFRQKHGAALFLRSKLNLVDLAGSEKVSKPSSDEQQLGEAKFVNQSLHHLESVIIALQKFNVKSLRNCSQKKQTEKCSNRCSSATLQGTRSVDGISRPRLNVRLMSASAVELGNGKNTADHEPVHVPYRNSLLTMVLQDSLGGNCNTAMIAALSAEEKNVSETVLTCRFAQRVARILNKPVRNEEVDRNMVIRHLQRRLANLHLELANYKHDSVTLRSDDESSVDYDHECVEVMRSFLAGRINDPVSHGINTPRKFRTSLRYLRQMVVGASPQVTSDGDQGLQSSDDRDSGLRTSSSSEPTSPLTSEVENDTHLVSNFIAQLPSPAPDIADSSQHRWSITTHESGISLSTDKEEPTPGGSLQGPSREMRQAPGPGTSEVPTQTGPLKTCEGRKNGQKDVGIGEGRVQPVAPWNENVLIWELELQKETLLSKSKTLTSRLAEQRARLVVMLRRGDPPEELQNEKIVELHLQKKQREVENELSFVIKKLADLKYTNRLKQCKTTKLHNVGTQSFKELELKEMSTRQKLLSRREQMRNFIGFSSPKPCYQTALSTSSFRSETCHSSLSRTSSMTSYWEDGSRDTGVQYRSVTRSPTLFVASSKRTSIGTKPVASRRRLSDILPQIGNRKPSSESSFSKRGCSSQGRFSGRNKRGALKNVDKSCPIAHYMNNSHQTLYHKSTFPRRIENGVCSDLHGTKTAQKTIPNRLKSFDSSESKLSRNSSSGRLQLKEQSSDLGKAEFDTIKPNVEDKSVAESDAIDDQAERSKQEDKSDYPFENIHLPSASKTATNKSRENSQERITPPATCPNREHRLRVLRIRQLVNAAEVIQRTWRLYKRNKNGE